MSAKDEFGRVWFSILRTTADDARPLREGDAVTLGSLTVGTITAWDARDDEIWFAVSPAEGVWFGTPDEAAGGTSNG